MKVLKRIKLDLSILIVSFVFFQYCQNPVDGNFRIFLQFARPDDDDIPSFGFEFRYVLGIPLNISFQFRLPVFGIMLRHGEIAFRASVPEASVYKHCNFPSRIAYVWFSRSLFPIQTVSRISRFAKGLANHKFWRSSFGFVGFHAFSDAFSQRRFELF